MAKAEAYESELSMNDDYYMAVKNYKEEAQKNGEWDKLSKIEQRFVVKVMEDYELNGFSLPKETR